MKDGYKRKFTGTGYYKRAYRKSNVFIYTSCNHDLVYIEIISHPDTKLTCIKCNKDFYYTIEILNRHWVSSGYTPAITITI